MNIVAVYVCVCRRKFWFGEVAALDICSYSASSECDKCCSSFSFSFVQLRIFSSLLVPMRVRPAIIKNHGYAWLRILRCLNTFEKSPQLLSVGIFDLLLIYALLILLISVFPLIFCWEDKL